MPAAVVERPNFDQYVLNHCTKYIARDETQVRHNYHGEYASNDVRASIAENWRFPIIDSYNDCKVGESYYDYNLVTFVYVMPSAEQEQSVSVVGTFGKLYEPIALRKIRFADQPTRYYACSLLVPKGQVHRYKFVVNGEYKLDPINPQTVTEDNGKTWSRFFTQLCTIPISFQQWELKILDRLTEHILPFRTAEGSKFLKDYYFQLDRSFKENRYTQVFRLDEQVGVANFIDKLVANEEFHRLQDYKICLSIIDGILRKRRPGQEPLQMSREVFVDLYHQMAQGDVPEWDYTRYSNPGFFLQLLRRHTITGAFAHPKYGGNIGAAGWSFLSQTFRDQEGNTLFDWMRSMEQPLGNNQEYIG